MTSRWHWERIGRRLAECPELWPRVQKIMVKIMVKRAVKDMMKTLGVSDPKELGGMFASGGFVGKHVDL